MHSEIPEKSCSIFTKLLLKICVDPIKKQETRIHTVEMDKVKVVAAAPLSCAAGQK